MDCENPADHVFVDVDAEGQSDLLGNSLAAPGAIAPFHFNDRVESVLSSVLWDLAVGLVWVKTAAGTFAWSAFCENAAESRALGRWRTAKHVSMGELLFRQARWHATLLHPLFLCY